MCYDKYKNNTVTGLKCYYFGYKMSIYKEYLYLVNHKQFKYSNLSSYIINILKKYFNNLITYHVTY